MCSSGGYFRLLSSSLGPHGTGGGSRVGQVCTIALEPLNASHAWHRMESNRIIVADTQCLACQLVAIVKLQLPDRLKPSQCKLDTTIGLLFHCTVTPARLRLAALRLCGPTSSASTSETLFASGSGDPRQVLRRQTPSRTLAQTSRNVSPLRGVTLTPHPLSPPRWVCMTVHIP